MKAALEKLEGVKKVEVSLEKASAYVEYEARKVTPDQMVAAVNQAGYMAFLPPKDLVEITLAIEGLKGPEDELKIKPALEKVDGIRKALVYTKEKEVYVEYMKNQITLQRITEEISKLGYKVILPSVEGKERCQR
ncbi:MAG TPA: cation transporter [Candidatus Limnocylindrales bacterium]|nr:cation transporter [Candidatus Limnocylindrales bacterium]